MKTSKIPPCLSSRHSWATPHRVVGGIESNPGVTGHAEGVRILCVCPHCGSYREIDSGGKHGATGKPCRTVRYFAPDEASLAYVEACAERNILGGLDR